MLACDGIARHYEVDGRTVRALDGVSLGLPAGSFTVLVGPSGCGKTTLLRILAGLTGPTEGTVRRTDGAAARPGSVGYVFQEPRLMPWLTVAGNIGFALKGRLPPDELRRCVDAMLALTGLAAFAEARPDQLSGGMASRVGLARALATSPDLLLLDEPFAALDAPTRRRLQLELVRLWQDRGPTVVFVTHDVEEAVLLADTIVRLDAGRIAERIAVPLSRPRDPTAPEVVALRRAVLAGFEEAEAPPAAVPFRPATRRQLP